MCAEKKKTKTQLRWDFNDRVYETIMESIISETKDNRKTMEVKLQFKMTHKKITLRMYGQEIIFEILGSGRVIITLKEGCHYPHNEELFSYTEDVETQEEFIVRLNNLMRNLMTVFLGKNGEDFHSYMDYVEFRGLSVCEAYEMLLDEGRNY